MIAARDPLGIRPFCLGKLDNTTILASETCALDLLGATYLRDVEPGEMLVIKDDGYTSIRFAAPQTPKHCIFEYIYFSRPDSHIFGENVDNMRRRMGKHLADESPASTAEIVISVPDSSNTSALGYARASGLKYELGLIRNHYVGRTFIFPSQRLRDLSVRLKFNTVKGVLQDREVVVVDDSIVRGTTLKKLAKLLREAGVKKIHVRISSPPVKHPCYYGMDFPTRKELVSDQHSVEEIQKIIDVDSLNYLTLEGMFQALKLDVNDYCTACFTGEYPIPVKDLHD